MTPVVWSIIFLVLTMGLVLAYVGIFVSMLFMVHYIAVNDWRKMMETDFSVSRRLVTIVGKFSLYVFTSGGLGVLYLWIMTKNSGTAPAGIALHFKIGVAIVLASTFLCFAVNAVQINYQAGSFSEFARYYQGKRFRNLILFCLVCMFTMYVTQLHKWTGKDNANLEAKQYWAAGQVLNGFRLALTTFIHPEIPVMLPADLLQKWIYKNGSRYLPENDGEIGVWQNSWFYYHYSRRDRWPLFVMSHKPSPRMLQLLDKWWFCLQTMATKPFNDGQMVEERYYRDYPLLAFFYGQGEGFYSGKNLASARRLAQIEEHVQRSRLLAEWLWLLGEKWQNSDNMPQFVAKHPKLQALRQLVLLDELMDIIHGEIYARDFACDNQSVQRYLLMRKEFAEPQHEPPAYSRMKSRKQARFLYDGAINYVYARSTKYVLKHYCGYEVGGKENNRRYASWAETHNFTPEKEAENRAKGNYFDEIKILEEMFNE